MTDTSLSHMTRHTLPVVLVAFTLVIGAGACATGQSATQSESTQTTTSDKETKPPSVPTPDELKGSPCGNPEWAKLPDGHGQSGDTDDAPPKDAPAGDGDDTGSTKSNPETPSEDTQSEGPTSSTRRYDCKPTS